MESQVVKNSRLNMKVGDLVRILENGSPIYWYYQVAGFYDLNDGGEGVELAGLTAGIHKSSISVADIDEVVFFDSMESMQKDIIDREWAKSSKV